MLLRRLASPATPLARSFFSKTLSIANEGDIGTITHRVKHADKDGNFISPWHDIPLHTQGKLFNFVAEIPKGSISKYEVATKDPLNPIRFDVKNGKIRTYPFESIVNYGMMPQTWEDSTKPDTHLKLIGDNDPLDVVEIGTKRARLGEVYPVKVLGVLGMVDSDEADWKVIAIRSTDPAAEVVHDLSDIEAEFGDIVLRLTNWFETYKAGEKNTAKIVRVDNAAFALDVIAESHESWKGLVTRQRNMRRGIALGTLESLVKKPLWTPRDPQ